MYSGFRCGISDIDVHANNNLKIGLKELFCCFCSLDVIEGEVHVVLHCPAMADLK